MKKFLTILGLGLSIIWTANAQTPTPTINGTPPPFTFTGAVTQTGQTFNFMGGSGTFVTLSGDATSTSTGGATTVVGINGTLLSGLTSGFLYNTNGTGIPSKATAAQLGTLLALPQYSIPYSAGTTSALTDVASPTVNGTYAFGWTVTGSAALAPAAITLGTAALDNTGTSGATIPLLNGANAYSAIQTYSVAPILTGLTGYVYANNASQVGAATTIPLGAIVSTAGTLAPLYLANATSGVLTVEPATGAITSYTLELPVAQPSGGNTYLSCTAANPSVCTFASGGSGSSGLSGMTQYGLGVAATASTMTSSVQPGSWTTGHTFVPVWQPSGSALAPTTVDANTLAVSSASTASSATKSTNIAGGALGSAPYQNLADTTLYIAGPTTTGHTFVYAWQPSGSLIAPTAVDANTLTVSAASTATTATTATNLGSGVANDIPYQTGAGATSFVAPVDSALIVTNGSGVPSESTTIPNGVVATTQSVNSADAKLATDNTVLNAFATPPTAGYGSGTPEPVAATTVSATGGITATSDGTHAGILSLVGKTANPSVPANSIGFLAPASASFTSYVLQFPTTAPASNYMTCAAPVSNVSACTWATPSGGSGTVTVVSSGALTSTALVTGGGTTTLQTPSTTSTLDGSGNLAVAAGGSVGSADSGTPKFTFATNKGTFNQPLYLGTTANQLVMGTSTNLTTASFGVPSGAVTLTFPITSEYMVGANSDTTTTHVLHATAVAGVGAFSAIAAGDIPSAALPTVTTTVSSGSIGTVTTNSTIVVCTTTCNLTPMQAAAGVQLCVRNAPGSATVITLNALASSNYYELTTHAGWGTAAHNLVSGGAATDSICLSGYDATHYMVMSYTGTWSD